MMTKKCGLASSMLLLLIFVFMNCQVTGAPLPNQVSSGVNEYSISLFANDVVMKNPNDSASGFLDIIQGTKLAAPPVLDLWYSCTATVRSDLSSMTLLVNGQPVASKQLNVSTNLRNNWQVSIPLEFIKPGVNEFTIAVLHRSIDGLCRDIDNEGNWFTIRSETTLKFQSGLRDYTLADYPYPFINEYLSNKINTILYMPSADNASLTLMLGLASNWGTKAPSGAPWRIAVNLGVPNQQPSGNEVCLGLIDKWNAAIGNAYPDNTAILQLTPLAGGYQRLLVSGNNEQGLALASDALSRDSFVKTLSGNAVSFNEDKRLTVKIDNNKTNGHYSLLDLGYESDVEVAGVFHQNTDIYLARPSNYSIGSGSFIELYFRHSKVLDAKKSAVTVYINGKPIRSAVLRPENADGGMLKVPIPDSELDQPGWQIRFAFYHDLGIVDCSKRYDDVAWSVVENRTNIYLAPGKQKGNVSLADFPYIMNSKDNKVMNVTMWISPEPTAEELTLACKLAYWIGQRNKTKIKWQVQQALDFDPSKASGTVIVLGKNTDIAKRKNLQRYLSICSDEAGTVHMAEWLDVYPDIFKMQNSYQVSRTDGNNGNLIYSFTYADAQSMSNYLNLALAGTNSLQGQVAFSDINGQLESFVKPIEKNSINNTWVAGLFANTAGVYAGIVSVVILGTIALMLYIKKRS